MWRSRVAHVGHAEAVFLLFLDIDTQTVNRLCEPRVLDCRRWLSYKDLCACRRVSRAWRNLCSDPPLYRRLQLNWKHELQLKSLLSNAPHVIKGAVSLSACGVLVLGVEIFVWVTLFEGEWVVSHETDIRPLL